MAKVGNAVVITLKGNLEGGSDTLQIKDEVKAYLEQGERRFILDMKEAAGINSTGVGVVISCLSSIREVGGELKVCGVSERARRAFTTTGVLPLFEVHATVEDALKAFGN